MKFREAIAIAALAGVVFSPGVAFPDSRGRTIDDSVIASTRENQYKKPSEKSLKRLKKYEHLIEYFPSFFNRINGHRVKPNYIRALICAESNVNPYAISPDGAIGLTQIMPKTGWELARELYKTGYNFKYVNKSHLRNLQPHHLNDPAINLLLACYATWKYGFSFGQNNLDLIAAAWNAGAAAVVKNGGCPPYNETIRFIDKLSGFMNYFEENGYGSSLPPGSYIMITSHPK